MSSEHNPDEIRSRMEELRNSLDDDVHEVSTSVQAKTNWRYYVQNYPWITLGAMTAAGYLIVPRRVQQVERKVADPDALARWAKKEKFVIAPDAEVSQKKNGSIMSSLLALAFAAGSRVAVGYVGNKFDSLLNEKVASREATNDQEVSSFHASSPKPK